MAALQCDICGGKLMGRPGGIFECDSCGMQYDTAWAKEKIQEIKGTVKVEGTVQVAGTVKLDGPVKVEGGISIENLLRRGWMALEDAKWDEAEKAFDHVLNLEPENARAHMGRYLSGQKVKSMAQAEEKYETVFCVLGDSAEIRRIRKLADPELAQWFARMDAETGERIRQRKENAKRSWEEMITRVDTARERTKCVQGRMLAAGQAYTVGLKADGTVMAVGNNEAGQCNASAWTDIVAIAAGAGHTVGLRADGTVAAVGHNAKGQCNAYMWTDIVAIAAGREHTVGLKKDGTVVAVGRNANHQCSEWSNIVAIAAGVGYTVGLKADGTVVATGEHRNPKSRVSEWKDIVAITAGSDHIVGLKADGTVAAVGWGSSGQCNVGDWKEIVAIAAGWSHTVGLKADGTVVAVGNHEDGRCNVSAWTDIVAITAGTFHTVGLKSDGTVVATQYTGEKFVCGQCDVDQWKLFNSLDTFEQEREEARELARQEAERKAAEARREAERQAEEARREAERQADEARREAERLVEEARRKAECRRQELLDREKSILREISGLGILAMRRRKELERELASILLERDKVAQTLEQLER